ncbi:MAG TPA: hypothetical protein VM345_00490 [Acidimicrobiales bacterium]|nr:hypothetical protein [Acidimicrobiales bacterium]
MGIGILVWAATLAFQRRPLPTWMWIVFGLVCVIAAPLMILQGRQHENPEGALRHSSGEFVVLHGYRERRQRGTRLALNWRYNARTYMFVPLGLVMAASGGLTLLTDGAWWKETAGAVIVILVLVATGALVRWLLLPVDAESKARLEAYYEDMRWDWGWILRKGRSLRARRRLG